MPAQGAPGASGTGLTAARRVPMYERAAAQLEAEIRSGRLGADERLMSERALADRLQVSRITIRRALAYLADKDLVRSSDRTGWFAGPVSEGSDVLLSFSDMGRRRGFRVSSQVLHCRQREASLAEAEELGIAPGSGVCDLARTRSFDGAVIAVTEAVVPQSLAPGLHEHDFATDSLYDVLRSQYRIMPARGRFAVQAAACEPAQARHLELRAGDPVLIFAQTGFDQLGRAFELARTVYRADRYLFRGTVVAVSDTQPVVAADSGPAGAGLPGARAAGPGAAGGGAAGGGAAGGGAAGGGAAGGGAAGAGITGRPRAAG
jgi:GntR family transcriptional regulator